MRSRPPFGPIFGCCAAWRGFDGARLVFFRRAVRGVGGSNYYEEGFPLSFQTRKAVIIGAGHVGSHCAYSLAAQGVCGDLVLIDIDEAKAVGQALDLADAVEYLPYGVNIRAGGYDELKDADVLVMAIGTPPSLKKTRMEGLGEMVRSLRTVVPKIRDSGFGGILISISNPADVVAHYLQANLGLPAKRVISTSTMLDSARLKRHLSEKTGFGRGSIHAWVMGEHGETSMIPWSNVGVAGKPLSVWMKEFPQTWGKLDLGRIAEDVKEGAYTIVRGKKSTEFGIGTTLCEAVRTIFHDEHKVLPVSVLLEGQYGRGGVYASVPARLGKDGVEEIVEIGMTPGELEKFHASCDFMSRNFELVRNME